MPPKDYHLSKFQILNSMDSIVEELVRLSNSVKEEQFFHKNDKWSIAENLEHIRLSFLTSWKKMFWPKFIIRRLNGKPDHDSLPYEMLEESFQKKTEETQDPCKQYEPHIDPGTTNKEKMLDQFQGTYNRFMNEFRYYWEDEHIDHYQVSHPVLGKVTIRELLYFNLFHCWEHFRIMRHRKSEGL